MIRRGLTALLAMAMTIVWLAPTTSARRPTAKV